MIVSLELKPVSLEAKVSPGLELISNEEMLVVDRVSSELHDTSVLVLMENAGCRIAEVAECMMAKSARVCILCGPGNNGGDGFVAARLLSAKSYDVSVWLYGGSEKLSPAARHMLDAFEGDVHTLSQETISAASFENAELIVDAIFGAGLARELDQGLCHVIDAMNVHPASILSVDVPTGLNGSTGCAQSTTVRANETITFFRLKPGHLLFPGRGYCGRVTLADIGVPPAALESVSVQTFVNAPDLWKQYFPRPQQDQHKYNRGHAVVVSGGVRSTGAARLAARGALRMGAGLVTIASPKSAVLVHAHHLTAIMLESFDPPDGLEGVLADKRRNAVLLGPGCGVGLTTRQMTLWALRSDAQVVLDADALTSFADDRDELLRALDNRADGAATVLTPHDGEFARLFPEFAEQQTSKGKLAAAHGAAKLSGSVTVLKGPDTVIANPDGRSAIANNAPPWLATAGSGDVLAGLITALLAQGMPAWYAACAGVWMHAEAASAFGPGLIAEDLPELIPNVLSKNMDLFVS